MTAQISSPVVTHNSLVICKLGVAQSFPPQIKPTNITKAALIVYFILSQTILPQNSINPTDNWLTQYSRYSQGFDI